MPLALGEVLQRWMLSAPVRVRETLPVVRGGNTVGLFSPHGLFTVALLEAISGSGNGQKGKDELKVRLSDGAVYFKQLDSYVTDRVKQLSKGYQHPVTGTPRTARDFPVSKPQ